ncbi:MAG TPA: hypothetical protein VF844_23610 [Ktedonobacteraceae bacterium]
MTQEKAMDPLLSSPLQTPVHVCCFIADQRTSIYNDIISMFMETLVGNPTGNGKAERFEADHA